MTHVKLCKNWVTIWSWCIKTEFCLDVGAYSKLFFIGFGNCLDPENTNWRPNSDWKTSLKLQVLEFCKKDFSCASYFLEKPTSCIARLFANKKRGLRQFWGNTQKALVDAHPLVLYICIFIPTMFGKIFFKKRQKCPNQIAKSIKIQNSHYQ